MGWNQDEVAFVEGKHVRFSWPEGLLRQDFIGGTRHVILVFEGNVIVPDAIKSRCSIIGDHQLLEEGVSRFAKCLDTGRIAYYDELEALSLIVQTEDENVRHKELVKANEKWPGGRVMEAPLLERAAVLALGEDHVRFLLCMGEASLNAPLKIKCHYFENTLKEDQELDLSVRMTPGQGMAIVSIHADFLHNPIELDFLDGMSDKDENGRQLTLTTVEDMMLRSFPPDAPHVVADEELWNQVDGEVSKWVKKIVPMLKSSGEYLNKGDGEVSVLDGGWFAKADDLYPAGMPLPEGLKPVERLRRKNVFGNDPEHRYPKKCNFSPLFAKLRAEYDRVEAASNPSLEYARIVRLIAWTYQSEYCGFDNVRNNTVKRVVAYADKRSPARPLPQEYTLCANLCCNHKDWTALWNAIFTRLQDHECDNNVEEDLRLLYNLLQFHPTFLSDAKPCEKGDACWKMMEQLLYWYPRYNERGTIGSKRIGYTLKCMLYLLRYRKFDGKVFVTQAREYERYAMVHRCLKIPPKAPAKLGLHRVVCDYLDGRGTIAGLPTD